MKLTALKPIALKPIALKITLASVVAATLGFSANSFAAVPHSGLQGASGSLQATSEALSLPLVDRLHDLRSQKNAYKNLVTIAFSKANAMDLRWKALTAMGRVGGLQAKSDLERALKSPEWFMRNAALISYAQMDRAGSLAWARKLLNDKALVVRAAAVDLIATSRDLASAPLLWEKLNAKENFKKNQSLFIRRRIVEALADFEGKGKESKFVALLQDKDESLHEPAMEALERITAKSVGSPGTSLSTRRAQWQQWYSDNKTKL